MDFLKKKNYKWVNPTLPLVFSLNWFNRSHDFGEKQTFARTAFHASWKINFLLKMQLRKSNRNVLTL